MSTPRTSNQGSPSRQSSRGYASRPSSTTRSRAGTPVKNIRRNSSRSDGGLTPLPDEEVPTILLTSGRASPATSTTSTQPDRQLASSVGHWTDGPTGESEHDDGEETRQLISEMSQRRRDFDQTENDVRATLRLFEKMEKEEGRMEVGAAVAQSAEPAVSQNELPDGPQQHGQTEQPDPKVLAGLQRIQELDNILRQKNSVARSLKRERLSRESSAAGRGSTTTYQESACSDSDEEDSTSSVDLELRSVHSMETRTFITEPKLGTRVKIGIQALRDATGGSDAARSAEDVGLHQPPLKKKGYKQGDFIQRNIVLGPEARYYSAMTEEEKERVETLLQAADDELDDDASSTVGGSAKPYETMMARPMSTSSSAFYPDEDEHERLVKIDRKLQLIIPEPEWETKSIVWSTPASAMASGTQTPISTGRWAQQSVASFSSSLRDTVMHDQNVIIAPEVLLKNEQAQLAEIDAKLERLKEGEERPVTREEIDRLLYECMRFEADMRSRQSDWDLASVSEPSRCSSRAYSEVERQSIVM
ncbi:hypothetical protein PhCBS80983_g01782 [Powellomyces hirtus]|uniref:Fibrous sheath-interacting protein 1 n=1 Tax=Powellomyces hirtus TaxID=109895 RepID=A0A507E8M1_9FUNG|nr:hypothetical protein PhCBS80983_g01782 [Powellomyces hirtus]